MPRTTRAAASFAVLAAALALAPSCKPKAGGGCEGTAVACESAQTALVCRAGKWERVTCGGALGCSGEGASATCDDSLANAGDACFGMAPFEYACSRDLSTALRCVDGRFVPYLPCRGPQTCKLIGRTVSCDTSIAAPADPCSTAGQIACSTDRAVMLECRNGVFGLYRNCRGKQGCYFRNDVPGCDETRAEDGDPCGVPGLTACSMDGRHEMQCVASRFVTLRPCRSGPCAVSGDPTRPILCN